VVKFSQKAKSYALHVQCFQGQPPAPVAYTDSGDLPTVRPVPDLNVAETVVLPTSALAIADVIGTGFTAVRKSDDSKKSCTTASAEFFALCTEQLGLCQEIVGPSAQFTVHNYAPLSLFRLQWSRTGFSLRWWRTRLSLYIDFCGNIDLSSYNSLQAQVQLVKGL